LSFARAASKHAAVSLPAVPPEGSLGRETCYRCFRPAGFCLCDAIPSVDNRTPVLVLQHPRERTHPFGTVRLLALGLSRVEVLVDHVGRLRNNPSLLGPLDGCALLYPSAQARDITSLTPAELPKRLIVIDGTWHQARTLYRDIPVLHSLPHVTLPTHLRSGFQIRKQPDVHCLSTVEATVFALRALEPETPGLEQLLGAFNTMQGRQLALPRNAGRQHKERRRRASRAIPRSLIEGWASLVVAYGESTFEVNSRHRRQLLSVSAERPSTGERFERLIKQAGVADAHLAYLGIDPSALESGVSLEAFRAEFAAFLRGDEQLTAWNQSTLDLLSGAAGLARPGVALKAAYHNLKRFRGSLEDIVAKEALAPAIPTDPTPALSRGTLRLNNAVLLAKFLHRCGNLAPA
jgi:DTW domain-containing protein YfiP